MNQFVKQAYVQGLAARAILRARIMQKQAGGVKDYAMAGGVGAGGGALIGALINYARKKNMLSGALAGAGIGGVAGLGYQGIKDLMGGKAGDEGQAFSVNNSTLPQDASNPITRERASASSYTIPRNEISQDDRRSEKDYATSLGLSSNSALNAMIEGLRSQGYSFKGKDVDMKAVETWARNNPANAKALRQAIDEANRSTNYGFTGRYALDEALKAGTTPY